MKKILIINFLLLIAGIFADDSRWAIRFTGEYQAFANIKNGSVSQDRLEQLKKEIEQIAQEALAKMEKLARENVDIITLKKEHPILAINLVTTVQDNAAQFSNLSSEK